MAAHRLRKELDITHLSEALQILGKSFFPTPRWLDLGLNLGLFHTTLEAIKANCRDDVRECLRECLVKWLNRFDHVDAGSTYYALINAIDEIGEHAAAENVKKIVELNTPACQVLQKHFESLMQLTLPMEIVHMLFAEGVISKTTFDDVEKSEGSLSDESLWIICSTVSLEPKVLKKFAYILLKSEDTSHVAKDIIQEYEQTFPQISLPQKQSGDVTELHLQITYQNMFDKIKVTFGKFIDAIAPLIEKTIPSMANLKTYLRRCFRELKPQLKSAECFDDVMDVIEERCTIINITCVEAVIDHYNIEEAKHHIMTYKSAVDEFCEEVKLRLCEKENIVIGPSPPLKCETIEFVLEWELEDYVLKQISGVLTKAFEDMAKHVQVRVIRKGNSIVVTCYAPRNLMDFLQLNAEKNLDTLKSIGVIKLTVGYCTIWDAHKRHEKGSICESRTDLANEIKSTFGQEDVLSMKHLLVQKQNEVDSVKSKGKAIDKELLSVKRILEEKDVEISQLKSELQDQEAICSQLLSNCEKKQQEIDTLYVEMHSVNPQSQGEISDLKKIISDLQSEVSALKSEAASQGIEAIAFERCTHRVVWGSDSVRLSSPTIIECEEVMTKLMMQNQTEIQWWIELYTLSSDCLLTVFTKLNDCVVVRLDINDTQFDNHCISELCQVLTNNKTIEGLSFWSSSLTSTGLELLSNAVSVNNTLKALILTSDNTITDEETPYIISMLSMLEVLLINFCPSITNNGMQHISQAVTTNTSLAQVYINGCDLCICY